MLTKGIVRFRRICRVCEEYFRPDSKYSMNCDSCKKKIYDLKVRNRRRR